MRACPGSATAAFTHPRGAGVRQGRHDEGFQLAEGRELEAAIEKLFRRPWRRVSPRPLRCAGLLCGKNRPGLSRLFRSEASQRGYELASPRGSGADCGWRGPLPSRQDRPRPAPARQMPRSRTSTTWHPGLEQREFGIAAGIARLIAARAFGGCSRADPELPHPAPLPHADRAARINVEGAGRPFGPQLHGSGAARKLKGGLPGSDQRP